MNPKNKICLSLFLVMVLLVLMTLPVAASAPEDADAPLSSAYITNTSATTIGGNGTITVNFNIVAKSPMTSLGATKIEIKNSSGAVMRTFYATSSNNMLASNKAGHTGSVTYSSATSGAKYYAIVYFKAENSSGSDTRTKITGYATAT